MDSVTQVQQDLNELLVGVDEEDQAELQWFIKYLDDSKMWSRNQLRSLLRIENWNEYLNRSMSMALTIGVRGILDQALAQVASPAEASRVKRGRKPKRPESTSFEF